MPIHIWRRAFSIALLFIIGTSFLAAQAAPLPAPQTTPGELDPTFAGFTDDGIVFEPGLTDINDTVLQPDGKIVAVGDTETPDQLAVFRYLSNGQLDPTFDDDGKAIFPHMFTATDVALQSDGRIVVGGTLNVYFQMVRLTSAGKLDPSFDEDGWVKDFDPDSTDLNSILAQGDGNIVACGSAFHNGEIDFIVTRYTANGARDTAFSDDGKVLIGFDGLESCQDAIQQPDGKLVVVGQYYASIIGDNDFAVARLNTNGTLDQSFDGDGKLTTGFGDDEGANAVALQPDGKIVVLGERDDSSRSHLARYRPNGALDASFDVDAAFDLDGKLTIPVDSLHDLAIQPDGKLLALGTHVSPDGDHKWALRRIEPNGSADTTFGENGVRLLDFGGIDKGFALALQPDGRILAAGTNGGVAVLARLWPDGTTFDTGGQQTHGLSFPPHYQPGYREATNALALQSDGSMVVAGQVYDPQYSFSDAFLTRFTPTGLPDITFGTNGSARVGSGLFNAATALVVQPDGKLVLSGFSAFNAQQTIMDFLVARFLPDGTLDPTFGTNGVTLVDFANGPDAATALALAPDGTLVVVGNASNGTRQGWGVARLTRNGQLDPSFDTDGEAFVDFNGSNAAHAVVVQPDGKIVVGGSYNDDFFLQRLLPNGPSDPAFGSNPGGYYTISDLGGNDVITALALDPNGWIYAAGHRNRVLDSDMALAQYMPEGRLATCVDPTACPHWPTGTVFVDAGTHDYAYALALRADHQLVAVGCSNAHFAGVQVRTDGAPTALPFTTDFVGSADCAKAVQFVGPDRLVLAGDQNHSPFSSDTNIALARFHTTEESEVLTPTTPPTGTVATPNVTDTVATPITSPTGTVATPNATTATTTAATPTAPATGTVTTPTTPPPTGTVATTTPLPTGTAATPLATTTTGTPTTIPIVGTPTPSATRYWVYLPRISR